MIEAAQFVAAARERGFSWYAGVPCSFLTPFINQVIGDSALTYIASANEGDALAAASGAALGGRRTAAMMQNSGLGNAVSPITSLNYVFRIPVLLIVTLRGAPGFADEPQHELMGRITLEMLDAMRLPWEYFPDQPDRVGPTLDRADAYMTREQRPYALVMRKGTVAPCAVQAITERAAEPEHRTTESQSFASRDGDRVSRSEALQRILGLTSLHSTVVIATTGYTGRELYTLADRPNQLYVVGSMGCASSLALGLSLARPELRVVVVDGDGAALMRMGNFATLGAYGGSNLVHILLDNGVHESTGGQFTVSGGMSFAGVAQACGYAQVMEGDAPGLLDALLGDYGGVGPRFGCLKIRPGAPEKLPRPAVSPVQVRDRFMSHIGSVAGPARAASG